MKKIALALAMLIALSGCLLALASCGDEETASSEAPATSSEAPATSSEEPAASSEEPAASSEEPAASSEEEPAASSEEGTDESGDENPSEEPGDESSEEEVSVDTTPIDSTVEIDFEGATKDVDEAKGTNLAVGCSYTGAEPAVVQELVYGGSLTDEVCPLELDYTEEWFGYWYNPANANCAALTNAPDGIGTIVLDLGSKEKIDLIRMYMFVGNTSGIAAPSDIKFEYSADGKDYVSIGSQFFGLAGEDNEGCRWVGFKLPYKVSAQYVRITMTTAAVWTFMCELEVY